MNFLLPALFSLLLINFSARSQDDDDLTQAASAHFEIYISSENESDQRIEWQIPNSDEKVLFLDEPIYLTFADIEKMEFGTDAFGRDALIIHLNYLFSSLLIQFSENYVQHYLAFTFDGILFYMPQILQELDISIIQIPMSAFEERSVFHAIYESWSIYNAQEALIEDYNSYSYDYPIQPIGVYVIQESDDGNQNTYQRLSGSEIYIYEEPLLSFDSFDSIYFQQTTDSRFLLNIEFDKLSWSRAHEVLNNESNQQLVLIQNSDLWSVINKGHFDENGVLRLEMNVDAFLDFESFYLQKYEWKEDDLNMHILERFYQQMNGRESSFSSHYAAEGFEISSFELLPPGAYQIVVQSVSKDNKTIQEDTLRLEILNSKWMISLVRDLFGKEKFELGANEYLTYEDDAGKLYLNFGFLGLISFVEQDSLLVATFTSDSWDYTLNMQIHAETNIHKTPEISGVWIVEELVVNDEIQDLQNSTIEYEFEVNGTLKLKDKSGFWFLSPSHRFFVMMDEEGVLSHEVFDVLKISNHELVLSVSTYAIQLKMKLVKL